MASNSDVLTIVQRAEDSGQEVVRRARTITDRIRDRRRTTSPIKAVAFDEEDSLVTSIADVIASVKEGGKDQ